MNKIGIITYHNTINYGALLQSFALESKLKELGADVDIINYHCKNVEDREHVKFPSFELNIINFLKNIKYYFSTTKKRKAMNNFLNKYIKISKQEYNIKNIKNSNDLYDKFVVGSDMVFELNINGGDLTYYLDFADSKKRYSYAASLGIDKIDNKYLSNCINELEKFQHLSVREEQAKEYFGKILKNKVYVDVDPTLLYDKFFWQKYEEKPKDKINRKYMLLYFLNETMPEFNIAREIAEKNNWDIYVLSNSKEKINGCKVIYNASVGEFLYYIHNAALVLTASYHGMIFSINYNTNFMYFCKKKDASRLDNIAILTGLTNRKLTETNLPEIQCDFDNANKVISKLRNKSIDYLKTLVDE